MVGVGGKHIALFNVEGTYYAIDDTCTHKGGPLSEGEVKAGKVTCPWHGSTFDVITGDVVDPPAPIGVSRYNVRVVGDDRNRSLKNVTPFRQNPVPKPDRYGWSSGCCYFVGMMNIHRKSRAGEQ